MGAWEARESMIDAWGCMGGKGKHDRRMGMHGRMGGKGKHDRREAWGCMGRRWDQKM